MSFPAISSPENAVVPVRIDRMLIVRLGAMGDIIHGLPAAAALRETFPEATLGWLIEERWAELLCTLPTPRSGPRSPQRPLVDRVHTVNTRQWRAAPFSPQTWERVAAALSDVRAARYEVAIDLQGAVRSSVLARWSAAPIIYGAAQPWENPASMFYTRRVITSGNHVAQQNLSFAEAVARRSLPVPRVVFPIDELADHECDLWLKQHGTHNFVLLNPGAGWGSKQWPAERYGQVAKQLATEGMQSVINSGPDEENTAHVVQAASGDAAVTFAGSLTQLIAITRRASLFIGGDTGPMHLAAALRVPVVGIFGPTDPARNGPFGTRNIVLRNPSSATTYKHVAKLDANLLEISSERVVDAARKLLKACHG